MKTKFEDYLLGLYSPLVQMQRKKVAEAKAELCLLVFEGDDWCLKPSIDGSIYTDNWYWNTCIHKAELTLKRSEKELFKQMLEESFLPFSVVVCAALMLGGMA